MKSTTVLVAGFGAALALAGSLTALGGTRDSVQTVAAGQSIQAAIDAAHPGETIVVAPGTYRENLTITKDRLTLRGAGSGQGGTVLAAPSVPHSSPCNEAGEVNGVCVAGEFKLGTDHVRTPVHDVRVSGVAVRGFSRFGVVVYNAVDTTVRDVDTARNHRYGLVAFASSLDQIGPLARSAEDAALLLEILAGHDPRDSTSLDHPVDCYSEAVGRPLKKLRVGIVREHFAEGLDDEIAAAVRQAVDVYQELGAEVVELSLPHSEFAVATYYVIAPCEASSNLARYDGVHYGYRTDERSMLDELALERIKAATGSAAERDAIDSPLVRLYRRSRAEGFGTEVKRRIMLGTYALSAGYYDAYYLKALKVRRLIRQDFDRAFQSVDLIAAPVTPRPAFKIGQLADDPLAMYLVDLYTVSANLCGIPAISVPCGFTKDNLPIGLQLLAPPLAEERLLRGAAMYQAATDWHQYAPEALVHRN